MKIPYGISDFRQMSTEGFHFVDTTRFLKELENIGGRYLIFLRPRRFGKSLWVSILQHYYGEEYAADFQTLFGKWHIGQNPTPLANSHLVLRFEFSRIDTTSDKETRSGFLRNVRIGAEDFLNAYAPYFSEIDKAEILAAEDATTALTSLFKIVRDKTPDKSIYLLIDEYDHFANEMLAFDLQRFKESVSTNGWVRKFYEAIKEATYSGTVKRIFITGVSPLTLDGLTSGFNIGTHISTFLPFHDMMGFPERDVKTILEGAGVPVKKMKKTLADIRSWYNGYRFHSEAKERLYNPDMVLYFAQQYQFLKKYPQTLLDTNIASDYGKIQGMFGVGDVEGNFEILRKILEEDTVAAPLTPEFSFKIAWTNEQFISLLYYLGMLTVKGGRGVIWDFAAPNHVIRELYFKYFYEMTLRRAGIVRQSTDTTGIALSVAYDNDLKPAVRLVEKIMSELSKRDYQNMNEKHVKSIFAATLFPTGQFFIQSEFEVSGGYVDLMLMCHPASQPHWQHAIELKYLKKSDASHLEEKTEAARTQLRRYLQDRRLHTLKKLTPWIIVFVGEEAKVVEVLQ